MNWYQLYLLLSLTSVTASILPSVVDTSPGATTISTTIAAIIQAPTTTKPDPAVTQSHFGCPTLIPCGCKNETIDCSSRRLYSTPKFNMHELNFSYQYLRLNNNHIVALLDNTFKGLKVTYLDLSFNKISNISDNAFNGIQSMVKVLDLQFNHLSTLPKAVSYLTNLEELHISHNRIITADEIDTHHMSITKFIAGGNLLKTWPNWISTVTFLEELDLAYNPIMEFPKDIQNLKWSLHKLIMDHCQLHNIPQELSQLRRLRVLDMSHNPIGDDGFLYDSFHGQSDSLTELSLQNVNITVIPKSLTALKSLSKLDLSTNHLEIIQEDVLPGNLTYLFLQGCGLHRISSAIADLKQLHCLQLANNNILTIENQDLQGFPMLINLDLSSNNLQYVSPHACNNASNLERFILFDNKLNDIPELFQQFPALLHMNLNKNPIQCNCEFIWPAQWIQYNTFAKVSGYCQNLQGMELSNFINNYNQYCHI